MHITLCIPPYVAKIYLNVQYMAHMTDVPDIDVGDIIRTIFPTV